MREEFTERPVNSKLKLWERWRGQNEKKEGKLSKFFFFLFFSSFQRVDSSFSFLSFLSSDCLNSSTTLPEDARMSFTTSVNYAHTKKLSAHQQTWVFFQSGPNSNLFLREVPIGFRHDDVLQGPIKRQCEERLCLLLLLQSWVHHKLLRLTRHDTARGCNNKWCQRDPGINERQTGSIHRGRQDLKWGKKKKIQDNEERKNKKKERKDYWAVIIHHLDDDGNGGAWMKRGEYHRGQGLCEEVFQDLLLCGWDATGWLEHHLNECTVHDLVSGLDFRGSRHWTKHNSIA